MAAKKEEQFQQDRDKLRARRKGGVEFVDAQIRVLMVEITKISRSNPKTSSVKGIIPAISYGDLFSATMGSMPALSAILHTARKRGVLAYEGEMLMQGIDDEVLITLLKDTIEDTPDFKSFMGKDPKKKRKRFIQQSALLVRKQCTLWSDWVPMVKCSTRVASAAQSASAC